MPFVADEDDPVAGLRIFERLEVHLRHQRAGGVDRPQAPRRRDLPHLGRHAVGREQQHRALGHLLDGVDEHGPLANEPVDNVLVVDDLVIHVNGSAVETDGRLERLDCHVHAGTETTRAGKQNLHRAGSGGWRRASGWARSGYHQW